MVLETSLFIVLILLYLLRLPRVPLRVVEDTRRGEAIHPICPLAILATM